MTADMREIVLEEGGLRRGSSAPALDALTLRWTRLPGIRRRDAGRSPEQASPAPEARVPRPAPARP